MAASATTASDRVRALNDQLRQHRIGGKVVITPGVQALDLGLLMLIRTGERGGCGSGGLLRDRAFVRGPGAFVIHRIWCARNLFAGGGITAGQNTSVSRKLPHSLLRAEDC